MPQFASLHDLVVGARPEIPIARLTREESRSLEQGVATMADALRSNTRVYGVTNGFGALVDHPGGGAGDDNGTALIHHLATGQGEPLDPKVCRLAVLLRLSSMRQGSSAVAPGQWEALARVHDAGFIPAMPAAGTVSASGDLQPLASAALSFAGRGEAWLMREGQWALVDSAEALRAIGGEPVDWPARAALAFVNGTSVSLAAALLNLHELLAQVRAAATLTARAIEVLGAGSEAFHPAIAAVRGQVGQAEVAGWIRDALPPNHPHRPEDRPLQEVYSLRGASQVLGAVLDQLRFQREILLREANGVTDNPVCVDRQVLHGANFHSLPVGLASDQMGLCAQQVAFLVERQLNVLCSTQLNGGLPPMLTPTPGMASGLAGVQISATSFVSSIRQRVAPVTLTTLPTNGPNQDHVPMSLAGTIAVRDALTSSRWVLGSLAVAVAQHAALTGAPTAGLWQEMAGACPPLTGDRPLAAEVRGCADLLMRDAHDTIGSDVVPEDVGSIEWSAIRSEQQGRPGA